MAPKSRLSDEAATKGLLTTVDSLLEHQVFDSFLKAASVCDKVFNCAYVTKQMEDEWKQEKSSQTSAVERVWAKMDKSLEVDLYRQFLFDEKSVSDDDSTERFVDRKLSSLLYCGDGTDTISVPGILRTGS
jgi:hypothetical protein